MTPRNRSTGRKWDQLEEAFAGALCLSSAERDSFVEQQSTDDPKLGEGLERLLPHEEAGRDWFCAATEWLRPRPAPCLSVPDNDPLVGTSIHQYHIIRRLGSGGVGIVYLADDHRLGRPVALKFLSPARNADPSPKEHLIQEARASAPLDHPNICTVFEIGETDQGSVFIAMAFLEGRSLKRVLAEEGALAPCAAADIALQVARALACAHRAGVVHRDVKPANLMVAPSGAVTLFDFGVALALEGPRLGPAPPAGTLAYMSPEQLAGEPVDGRADLWALGAILWEMLTGARPFEGASAVELIDAIELEPPGGAHRGLRLPAGMAELVDDLLRKRLQERLGDADEVAVRIESFLCGRTRS